MPIADAFSLFVRSLCAELGMRPALLQIRGGAARELEGAGVNRHRIRIVTVAGVPVDLRGLHWTVDPLTCVGFIGQSMKNSGVSTTPALGPERTISAPLTSGSTPTMLHASKAIDDALPLALNCEVFLESTN